MFLQNDASFLKNSFENISSVESYEQRKVMYCILSIIFMFDALLWTVKANNITVLVSPLCHRILTSWQYLRLFIARVVAFELTLGFFGRIEHWRFTNKTCIFRHNFTLFIIWICNLKIENVVLQFMSAIAMLALEVKYMHCTDRYFLFILFPYACILVVIVHYTF